MPDIKETLIDLLTGYSLDTYEDVQYVADELIAKGVLPVVRCKDCKWFADNNGGEWYGCWLFNGIFHGQSDIPTSDDFCSYGERKEAEGDG